jgi:rRNA maturation RNase YbeY
MAIFFHAVGVDPGIKHKNALKRWIKGCVLAENKSIGEINIIFCSDEHLLEINRTHLNHDYYTDIITFDYTADSKISGDLYISYERVIDNAQKFKEPLNTETYRVIIHGIMHLCGYKDKTNEESILMRKKELNAINKIEKYFV